MVTRNPKQKLALLGAGYIAEWHAKALASVSNVELVAVCDQQFERARALADKFNIPAVYRSIEDMLASERLDSVHVLLPPDRHFPAAKTILTAGVNVLLEKPMCDRTDDCESLVRLAEARNLKLGVGHNFLFADCYRQLRRDLASGIIGRIDHLSITWHRELPQLTQGPFDAWMLRDPRNIMLEVGSHCVALMLDLIGQPEQVEMRASNPVDLPTGAKFFRRWQATMFMDRTAVDLRFSFVPGFNEFTIHVRGSLASASVDFDRNTYTLLHHRTLSEDFDRYATVVAQARNLQKQARRTMLNYILAKLRVRARGNPYEASIASVIDAFYGNWAPPLDRGIQGKFGAAVIRNCEDLMRAAAIEEPSPKCAPSPANVYPVASAGPGVLVLGGTGFIGQELVRQLTMASRRVRLLVRNPSKLPSESLERVECMRGDLTCDEDLRRAMAGVDCVFHLARANVKSWGDYQRYEIEVTRRAASIALAAHVRRFIYTGTIDSYYAGERAGTITEDTPLDPQVARRNLYARAKAASEELLLRMYRQEAFPVVILRPGIVVGRGGSPFHWGIGMWWYNSACQLWGDGRNKLPLVLVEDVAKGLIAACDTPGIEGQSFNLVDAPCLSAEEYLDELDRCGGIRIQRYQTSILRFYLADLFKWSVKVLVRHPEHRLPSYRDWESRRQCAIFDCSRAKRLLGWKPASNRADLVNRGIAEPLSEAMR